MFYSVHLYGADVQLLQLKGTTLETAKAELLDIMSGVNFDQEQDGVIMFEMQPDGEGKSVLNYEEYLQGIEEEE